MRLSPQYWTLWTQVATVTQVLAGMLAMFGPLNASYAASGHPVDHATGQLAFDAAWLRGYYSAMEQAGGLDRYHRSQVLNIGLLARVRARRSVSSLR